MTGSIRRLLIVFAKLPEPGETKTRLARRIGAREAARLYGAFLDDTVAAARSVRAEREIHVVERPDAVGRLSARFPGMVVRPQRAGDLGERLRGAFAAAFARGAHHVLVTGSDHPTLPASFLDRGLDALVGAQLVLGPTRDGGYYAVGLRRSAWPRATALFERIPWSTPEVLVRTRTRARELALCHVELPVWYDIDEPEQLPDLRRQAAPGSRTAELLARLETIPS